jgi:hypothetical protein
MSGGPIFFAYWGAFISRAVDKIIVFLAAKIDKANKDCFCSTHCAHCTTLHSSLNGSLCRICHWQKPEPSSDLLLDHGQFDQTCWQLFLLSNKRSYWILLSNFATTFLSINSWREDFLQFQVLEVQNSAHKWSNAWDLHPTHLMLMMLLTMWSVSGATSRSGRHCRLQNFLATDSAVSPSFISICSAHCPSISTVISSNTRRSFLPYPKKHPPNSNSQH